MRLRDARPEERPEIRALTLRAYRQYASLMAPSAWKALEGAVVAALETRQDAEWIVAELGGRLVGSVMLFSAASSAYDDALPVLGAPELRLLAVAPEARGRGVGRALVEECVRRARRSGASELGLHTSESMRAAVRLYEKMGFRRAPDHDFRPEGAELVQAYRLPLRGPATGTASG